MHIRDERPEDASMIATITNAAFAPRVHDEATLAKIAELQRAAGITEVDLAESTSALSEARIVDVLRRDGALTLSLVGETDDGIVSHVAFSQVCIGDAQTGWYALGPVSVRPDLQNMGYGSALIRAGLSRLMAQGATGCVLLGYPPYYARFGFELDAKLTYHGKQNPALQRLLFNGKLPEGDVVFHQAFVAG